MGGRVNSSVFRNHIYFDFVSPHLVERHKARTFGTCIVRVSVHKGGRLTAERMSSKCAKAYAFNPPQCSLGVVLSSGRNSGALPHTFEPTAAVLRKSSPKKAGPSWFFMIDGVNYSASPCP